jgi:hypothetical protein
MSRTARPRGLDQAAHSQVLLDDDICIMLTLRNLTEETLSALTIDRRHDEPDLHGIRRTREMSIDLLRLVLIQAYEAIQDVIARRRVIRAALVIREVILHGADGELLLEPVDLVQEEDYARLDEPARVADAVEEREGLLHAVHRFIFEEELVVLGDGDEEEDGRDVLEAVYPLLAFGALAADVEHAVGEVADDERRLGYTCGLDT